MPIEGADLQPLDRTVKLRLSRRQLSGIDRLASEFGISRSWFLREALAVGIPAAADRLRKLFDDGLRPAGAAVRPLASGPRRGPLSDGARPDRWVRVPSPRRRRRPVTDPVYEEE